MDIHPPADDEAVVYDPGLCARCNTSLAGVISPCTRGRLRFCSLNCMLTQGVPSFLPVQRSLEDEYLFRHVFVGDRTKRKRRDGRVGRVDERMEEGRRGVEMDSVGRRETDCDAVHRSLGRYGDVSHRRYPAQEYPKGVGDVDDVVGSIVRWVWNPDFREHKGWRVLVLMLLKLETKTGCLELIGLVCALVDRLLSVEGTEDSLAEWAEKWVEGDAELAEITAVQDLCWTRCSMGEHS